MTTDPRAALDRFIAALEAHFEIASSVQDAEAVAADASNGQYYTAAELDALVGDGTVETWLTAMNEYFEENGKIEGETVAPADYFTFDLFTEAGK